MMNHSNIAVDVHDLMMVFGKETVLHGVNIQFEKSKIHGIIGRNGSGKTVMFKCICGFLKPREGYVKVFGKRIGTDCDFAPKTGMLIETPGFLPHETGFNNLLWLSRIGSGVSKDRIKETISIVGLDPTLKKKVLHYSLGMRQRLGIAQALMEDPDLLILDEPMNGLDNRGVAEIRKLLLAIRANGKTIIIASHNPLDIDELCDTVHEMDAGVITHQRG